jgi:hypothetical protein
VDGALSTKCSNGCIAIRNPERKSRHLIRPTAPKPDKIASWITNLTPATPLLIPPTTSVIMNLIPTDMRMPRGTRRRRTPAASTVTDTAMTRSIPTMRRGTPAADMTITLTDITITTRP